MSRPIGTSVPTNRTEPNFSTGSSSVHWKFGSVRFETELRTLSSGSVRVRFEFMNKFGFDSFMKLQSHYSYYHNTIFF